MKTLREQLQEAQAEVQRLKKMARCKREPIKGCIGGVIQQERESYGWTLDVLDAKSGVSKGLISRIESSADSNPTFETLRKIATALKMPLSALIEKAEKELI